MTGRNIPALIVDNPASTSWKNLYRTTSTCIVFVPTSPAAASSYNIVSTAYPTSATVAVNMAANGNYSDEESPPGSPALEAQNEVDDIEDHMAEKQELKSALKKTARTIPPPQPARTELPEQPDPKDLDVSKLTPLSPEIISRQATINIGTIGHVAHGKSTVVKAISGVQTVRFKNELERNITIKLGYANAKIYKCDSEECPRPGCYRSFKSEKEVELPCEREGCTGRYKLLRHVS